MKFMRERDDVHTENKPGAHNLYERISDKFMQNDELFYDYFKNETRPEHEIFKKDHWRVHEDARPLEMSYLSNQGPNELPPLQPDIAYAYQDIHYTLEKWTIFR